MAAHLEPTTRDRRRLRGAAAILIGAALLALALPIAVASLAWLPARPAVEEIRRGSPPSTVRLRHSIATERMALRWREDGHGRFRLALAHLALAGRAGVAGANRHLQAAERELVRGLSLAPANAQAWTRLALVRYRLSRPAPTIVEALDLSIRTGPTERGLAPARAELILRLWPLAARRIGRSALDRQLRLAWQVDRAFTTAAAQASGRADVLRRAVGAGAGAVPPQSQAGRRR
ncbi:hypothetical protein [Ferruginivarius sediminum]|uniref:hypothetical protein n=1 Tax=Ferruginivarius sediminum TaxID=2661937 RepID=UPI0011C06999|nr:hypothetical protein [Ferruginivarius sediminum]